MRWLIGSRVNRHNSPYAQRSIGIMVDRQKCGIFHWLVDLCLLPKKASVFFLGHGVVVLDNNEKSDACVETLYSLS